MNWKSISMLGLAIVAAGCAPDPVGPTATPDRVLAGPAFSMGGDLTWAVQSDYFGERNAVAQSRTIRSMALSHDGSSVYTGLIQSPNVGSNALRKVSSAILAVSGTDHAIFGNGMPGGTGGFGQVGGQPVYAGGLTNTFQGWTAIGNSPRGLATDDRGYVYAALSSGISPANQVRIYPGDLSLQAGAFSVTGPTGVAIGQVGSTYYAYVASGTLLRRWDVTNPAAPVMDAAWTPPVSSGAVGLTVDADGTVYLAGGNVVRRISPDGSSITHTSAGITGAADVAAYGDKLYVIARTNPITPYVFVLNKADLTSGGPDIAVPDLIPERLRGLLAQFTAIDIGPDGKIYVSEENYTAGNDGVASYTPPVTTFNLTPGAITGRIYFDRVLVSSALSGPSDTEAPAVFNVAVSPNPAPYTTSEYTLTADAEDNVAVTSASYSINEDPSIPFTFVPGSSVELEASLGELAVGVYDICVTAEDAAGNVSNTECTMLAVYDPSAGFVTGGGWFNSPAEAYILDPLLTGKATFGFVSKYVKGKTLPTGNTEFQFKAGNLSFSSSAYEWLVVNQGGTNAQFKGTGALNGAPGYKFMVWAKDDTPDTFRIQIEDGAGTVVYDNKQDGSFGSPLGGGNIVIHVPKK